MTKESPAAYRITDLSSSDRPRERLAELGPQALSNAELIAISVRKEYHHHGIGRKLVEHLEAGFQEWQVDHFYHVATDIRDPLSNAFYLGMGFNKYGVKRFTNFSLQIYEKKIFKQV